jgi:hypothetical protein
MSSAAARSRSASLSNDRMIRPVPRPAAAPGAVPGTDDAPGTQSGEFAPPDGDALGPTDPLDDEGRLGFGRDRSVERHRSVGRAGQREANHVCRSFADVHEAGRRPEQSGHVDGDPVAWFDDAMPAGSGPGRRR